jgi:genome maintenance exonuclease 1
LRKIFEHEFLTFEDLKTVTMHDKRYYELPNGTLAQSVTTRIGEASDKTALMEWRARVGQDEAQRITTQAANRGTAIHTICENYLMNEINYPKGSMPTNIDMFKSMKPVLDEHIGKIFALEAPLYSYALKAAGRTDCIAEWDNVPSIIDFKTSRKPKKEEWIENYFLQATCYALMAEERTNMIISQFAIVIAVDHENPQVFVKDKKQYIEKVKQIFC